MAVQIAAAARAVRSWVPEPLPGRPDRREAPTRHGSPGSAPARATAGPTHAAAAEVVEVRATHLGPGGVMREPQVTDLARVILTRAALIAP